MPAKTKLKLIDEYDIRKRHITDAFQFASRVHDLGRNPPSMATGALWFRGQSRGEWKLEPSIGRIPKDGLWFGLFLRRKTSDHESEDGEIERMQDVEYNLLNRFRRHAHAFLKRVPTVWETITWLNTSNYPLASSTGQPIHLLLSTLLASRMQKTMALHLLFGPASHGSPISTFIMTRVTFTGMSLTHRASKVSVLFIR